MRDGPFVESVERARERAMNEVPELVLLVFACFVVLVVGTWLAEALGG
jgi:hypothetical protein